MHGTAAILREANQPFAIDLFRHAVTRSGAAVHLTPKEFAVLPNSPAMPDGF